MIARCSTTKPLSTAILVLIFAVATNLRIVTAAAQPVPADTGLPEEYLFDRWQVEDGLPANNITAMLQGRDGYLWIGTASGLVRFNGVEFISVEGGPNQLRNNDITALWEDSAGDLWIGTNGGGLSHYHRGRFTNYTTKDGLSHDTVLSIIGDREGNLWISTPNALNRLKNGRFTQYGPVDGFISERFNGVEIDQHGTVWAATGDGLFRYGDSHFTPISMPSDWDQKYVMRVYSAPSGILWASGRSNIVARFEGDKVATFKLPGKRARSMVQTANGDMWFGMYDAGLMRLRNGQMTVFTTEDGLLQNDIRTLVEDREGNLWVGTANAGLNRMRPKRLNTLGPVSPGAIYPIFEDATGQIWFGQGCGGLFRVAGRSFEPALQSEIQKRNTCIWSIAQTPDGTMWIASWGGGLYRSLNGNFTVYNEASGLANALQALHTDRKGQLWIGTYDRGLYRLEDDQFKRCAGADGKSVSYITTLLADHKGNVWVGSMSEGLSCWTGNSFTRWGMEQGLPSMSIKTLHEDAEGQLWIGTGGAGLCRYQNGKFSTAGKQQGFPDGVISQILEDNQGNFWIGCNQGIFRVGKRELQDCLDGRSSSVDPLLLGRDDGMQGTQCSGGNSPAGCKSRDGRLWFGTSKGLVVIDPTQFSINHQAPPVVIERVVLDEHVFWKADTGYVNEPQRPKPASDTTEIIIPAGTQKTDFFYAGLSFTKPERLHFRYRLTGLDQEWVNAGNRRAAYYTGLPPGRYTFEINASNADGIWNPASAMLRVTVLPQYWQTWWFESLAALAAFGAAFAIYHWRVQALHRQQAAQALFARQLIESQERERKRIAGELHDSLEQNLLVIKNQTLLLADCKDSGDSAEMVQEISSVASAAIEEVRAIAANLRPYQLDRLGLTRALRAVVRQVSEFSEIEFVEEIENIDGLLPKEFEINLYRILQEALNNILKHSKASTSRIAIRRDGNEKIRMIIEDNGQGFSSDLLTLDEEGRGFGLNGIAERVRIMRGHWEIVSKPSHGTKIVISVPRQPPRQA